MYEYRLWHQLTQKLFEFFAHSASQPYRVDVFERFVRDFEGKLNQLRLVEMGVKVSKDIDSLCLLVIQSKHMTDIARNAQIHRCTWLS